MHVCASAALIRELIRRPGGGGFSRTRPEEEEQLEEEQEPDTRALKWLRFIFIGEIRRQIMKCFQLRLTSSCGGHVGGNAPYCTTNLSRDEYRSDLGFLSHGNLRIYKNLQLLGLSGSHSSHCSSIVAPPQTLTGDVYRPELSNAAAAY